MPGLEKKCNNHFDREQKDFENESSERLLVIQPSSNRKIGKK